MAARFPDVRKEPSDDGAPSALLSAAEGQRVLSIEVPSEVAELGGADMQRFFSDIKVSWSAEVTMPEIEIRDDGKPER